ncbi:GNAT family N-acetyltransferase [Flavobacterium sp.]|jgi:ribosomal protein S18 acetylase RimI-like enzyme|uniref:GNAT family N-acetyltransferase n=1 Tax=Flavobacterium sp. TaxID=239 RepID=UPI0037BEB3EF
MKIVLTRKCDIKGVAACHRKAFPNSLSSMLHPSFSIKLLSWYLDNPRGIIFHIEEKGEILGYCGGIKTNSPELEGSSTSMAQHTFKLMVKCLFFKPWLIFHRENFNRIPLIFKNVLLKLGLIQKKKKSSIKIDNFVPFWGLVVIGVLPSHQGKGIGSHLLQEFERLAKNDNIKKIYLSVKKENINAIKSYEKSDWQISFFDKKSLTMYKNI